MQEVPMKLRTDIYITKCEYPELGHKHGRKCYAKLEAMPTAAWCLEHNNGDIHKQRDDDNGPWACREWHPDDPCYIAMVYLVPAYPEDLPL